MSGFVSGGVGGLRHTRVEKLGITDQKLKQEMRRQQQIALIKKRRDEMRAEGMKPYQFWLTEEQARQVKIFVEQMNDHD